MVALLASALAADPNCGDVFVFRAKPLHRPHCIYWDESGMILATKWFEAGRFVWPPIRNGAMQMTREEYSLLLAGIDWTRVKPNAVKRPSKIGLSHWLFLKILPCMAGSYMPL